MDNVGGCVVILGGRRARCRAKRCLSLGAWQWRPRQRKRRRRHQCRQFISGALIVVVDSIGVKSFGRQHQRFLLDEASIFGYIRIFERFVKFVIAWVSRLLLLLLLLLIRFVIEARCITVWFRWCYWTVETVSAWRNRRSWIPSGWDFQLFEAEREAFLIGGGRDGQDTRKQSRHGGNLLGMVSLPA